MTGAILWSVFVQGTPKAQPRAKATTIGGHARMYTPGSARGWRERVMGPLLPYKPLEPYDEPLALELRFLFPRPASHYTKKGLRPTAPRWVGSRPDWDNLGKAVCDEMTELGFWTDDSRVVQATVTKLYSDEPSRFGCLVTLLRPE